MLITVMILHSFLKLLIVRERASTSIARRSQGEHHAQWSKGMSGSWTTILGVIELHTDLGLGALAIQTLMTFEGAGAAV